MVPATSNRRIKRSTIAAGHLDVLSAELPPKLAEDLVLPPKLAVLRLKLLDPGPLIARQASAPARVDLGLAKPLPKRLRGVADLARRDRDDDRPLGVVLTPAPRTIRTARFRTSGEYLLGSACLHSLRDRVSGDPGPIQRAHLSLAAVN